MSLKPKRYPKLFEITRPLTWGYTLLPLVLINYIAGFQPGMYLLVLVVYFSLPYHTLRLLIKRISEARNEGQNYPFSNQLLVTVVLLPSVATAVFILASDGWAALVFFAALLLIGVLKAIRFHNQLVLGGVRLLFSFAHPILLFGLGSGLRMSDVPLAVIGGLCFGWYCIYSIWRADRDKRRLELNLAHIIGSRPTALLGLLFFGSALYYGWDVLFLSLRIERPILALLALAYILLAAVFIRRGGSWPGWRQFLWIHWLGVVACGFSFINDWTLLFSLSLAGCGIGIVVLRLITWLHLRDFLPMTAKDSTHLPSVSLLLPTRNEATRLEPLLRQAAGQTYEKLEVIVLNDQSEDNTGALIRRFASRGIRFIEGTPTPEGWNPKAHALEQLAAAASGDFLLFIDADVELDRRFVQLLMRQIVTQRLDAASVLPRYRPHDAAQAILRPLLDSWFLMLPLEELGIMRPVRDATFVIGRQSFDAMGGFGPSRWSPLPALGSLQRLSRSRSYALLRASAMLPLIYEKRASSNASSRLRNTYPVFSNDFIFNLMLAAAALSFFGLPLLALVSPAPWLLRLLAALIVCVTAELFYRLARATMISYAPLGLFYPITIVWEIGLMLLSAFAYELGAVRWKGRKLSKLARAS